MPTQRQKETLQKYCYVCYGFVILLPQPCKSEVTLLKSMFYVLVYNCGREEQLYFEKWERQLA